MTSEHVPWLQALAAKDALASTLGVEYVAGDIGQATVRMTVAAAHLNFNGTCHGGAIFTLADTAFGLASNSHRQVAAAIDAHLSFNSAVREGETLTATARERSRGRTLATYTVEVTREDGRVVSVFTGTVFITGSQHAGAD